MLSLRQSGTENENDDTITIGPECTVTPMHFGIGVFRALFSTSSFYRLAFSPSGIDTAFLDWEHVDTYSIGKGNFGRFAINERLAGSRNRSMSTKPRLRGWLSSDSPKESSLELDIERLDACL